MSVFSPERGLAGGRRDAVAALVAVSLAALLRLLPAPDQQRIAHGIRATALRPFLSVREGLEGARRLTAEVERLRARTDSLAAALAARRPLEEENRRLRALLGLRERAGPVFVAAEVLRPGTPGSESTFLLDVGARDGVRPWSPVITAEGLVGVVREAGEKAAVAMDWTHPDFRASVMTADGREYGIVEPRRGRFREEDRLLLTGVSFHADLPPGTPVVTSGRGGVYPRGIPVGTVLAVAGAEGKWRKSFWVRPTVPPGAVTHVLVGRGGLLPPDLEALWRAAGDGPGSGGRPGS